MKEELEPVTIKVYTVTRGFAKLMAAEDKKDMMQWLHELVYKEFTKRKKSREKRYAKELSKQSNKK